MLWPTHVWLLSGCTAMPVLVCSVDGPGSQVMRRSEKGVEINSKVVPWLITCSAAPLALLSIALGYQSFSSSSNTMPAHASTSALKLTKASKNENSDFQEFTATMRLPMAPVWSSSGTGSTGGADGSGGMEGVREILGGWVMRYVDNPFDLFFISFYFSRFTVGDVEPSADMPAKRIARWSGADDPQ